MIELSQIKGFFPGSISENKTFHKYMLKEYILLQILEYLSTTTFVRKLSFIGGTYLRLVKKIDRFSEDIDFDCKNLTKEEFFDMTDKVLQFLKRSGYEVETRDKPNPKLSDFRRNIYFPQYLFDMGLSGYKNEKFLIKIESENQRFFYKPENSTISGCGLFFKFPTPSEKIVCSMKISALLNRGKGRDFYDVMFLLSRVQPDFNFLKQKDGVSNMEELKDAFHRIIQNTDLENKSKDFSHLTFNPQSNEKILLFKDFVNQL